MKGILIAVFLGMFGGFRFYKKQKLLGFIYLFTFGLVLFGWAFDVVQAIYEYVKGKRHPQSAVRHDSFTIDDCQIAGSFAECKKDPTLKRFGIVATLPVGTVLSVETAYYEGKPYFMVCAPTGLDIGSFPAEVSAELKKEYPNASIRAILTNKDDVEFPRMSILVNR